VKFLRAPRGAVLFLFLFALALRFIGLTWGLPNAERWYSYHPDERDIANAVFQLDFLAGQWNPHFYNYPSLFLYLTYIVHGAMAMLGFTHAPPETWSVLREIIWSGRLVSAFLGAATAPLTFLIAREWFRVESKSETERTGKKTDGAAFAGLLMALLPGHIQHSHFASVDVTATFFVALSLLFATRALRDKSETKWRAKQLLLSALFAGFAAATKYNAVIVLVAPLLASWLCAKSTPEKERTFLRSAIPIFGVALFGFIAGCPGALRSPSEFWGNGRNTGFAYELLVHPKQGHGEIFLETGHFGWWHHLGFNLPFVMTTPLLLLSLCGLAIIVVQMSRTKNFVFLPAIAFTILFFVSLGFSQVRFMRYVFPLLPVLCPCAVWVLCSKIKRPFEPKKIAPDVATTFFLLFFLARVTMNSFDRFTQIDPRDQAAQWMRTATASQSKPVSIGLANNPWFWTPPFTKENAPPGTSPQKVAEILVSNANYSLKVIGFDAQKLAEIKPQFFVMSEFEWQDKVRLNNAPFLQFMESLNRSYKLQEVFGRENGFWKSTGKAKFPSIVPHDYLYANPQMRIYTRRPNAP